VSALGLFIASKAYLELIFLLVESNIKRMLRKMEGET
jgi:hypothetical protein